MTTDISIRSRTKWIESHSTLFRSSRLDVAHKLTQPTNIGSDPALSKEIAIAETEFR